MLLLLEGEMLLLLEGEMLLLLALISWRRITYGQSDTELVHKMLLRCNSGATRPCGPRAQDVKDASCRDEDATPWGISCSKMKICASVFHGMKICASIFPRARGQVFRPLFELGWIKYNSRVCSACSSPCCAWIESEDKLNSMLCMTDGNQQKHGKDQAHEG